jgi:WD40 repeat protein
MSIFFFSVYDVLTGKVHSVLSGHTGCVQDVSWHPHRLELVSTSVSFVVFYL